MLVFLVMITNKLDKLGEVGTMPYFACCTPLYLTFFTLIIASFGARGGKIKIQKLFRGESSKFSISGKFEVI